MCGLFGVVPIGDTPVRDIRRLARLSEMRGRDSAGLAVGRDGKYVVDRSLGRASRLVSKVVKPEDYLVLGHSRLVTDGLDDNQPVVRDGIATFHNGIVVNAGSLWENYGLDRHLTIDTEIIPALARYWLGSNGDVDGIGEFLLGKCQGVVSALLLIPEFGKLVLVSNNGSLFRGVKDDNVLIASESGFLKKCGVSDIEQVVGQVSISVPQSGFEITVNDSDKFQIDLIPRLASMSHEERLLDAPSRNLRRCAKCVLPETMPFITFDAQGICNYCHNYRPRNKPQPLESLKQLLEPHRQRNGGRCIVPFSGGRDSSFALHFIAEELNLKPIAYTYDWGMISDLGRRNISRMCSALEVENIIVAADIGKKRRYIRMNLEAWLRRPELGMVPLLTAGDKHFFRFLQAAQLSTGVDLNIWGINPLEVTHFKSGFLGVPPDFLQQRVYTSDWLAQVSYQRRRIRHFIQNPAYINRSLWDTYSGEYARSFGKKRDYYHLFDYWKWDEEEIDTTLAGYEWERALDTQTTWRIGDGSAAFYNYVYMRVAGFTEHDTFRSNQIREGDLTREAALDLVEDENRPRYPNIKWYLDCLGMDFSGVIQRVNSIPVA